MIDLVMSRAGTFAYLQGELLAPNGPGLDRLRLVEAPLVPEVRLHLAQDAIVWWARMEAEVGAVLTAPFWATAWAGGQALARCVLDRPVTVADRRILDVGVGVGTGGHCRRVGRCGGGTSASLTGRVATASRAPGG